MKQIENSKLIDFINDIWMINDSERVEKCKSICPNYHSCKANFKNCKFTKKRIGLFG